MLLALILSLLIVALALSGNSGENGSAPIVSQAAVPEVTQLGSNQANQNAAGAGGPQNPAAGGQTVFTGEGNTGSGAVVTPVPDIPLPPTPVQTPPPVFSGTLSGRVSGEEMTPLAHVSVFLADSAGRLNGASTHTDAAGNFHFPGLSPGAYRVYFSDDNGEYQPGWYPDPVTVRAGQDSFVLYSMQAVLRMQGKITGTVTNSSGQGIAGVQVMAYAVDEPTITLELRGLAITDKNGDYTISGLQPLGGNPGKTAGYKIFFSPPGEQYAFQWYRGQPGYETAELIPLLPGETVGKVNAKLSGGGTISGVVIADGAPAANATVDIFDSAGVIVDEIMTDSGGGYQSVMLPAGSYRIRANLYGYSSVYYKSRAGLAVADPVQVLAGKDSGGIDISLHGQSPKPGLAATAAAGQYGGAGNRAAAGGPASEDSRNQPPGKSPANGQNPSNESRTGASGGDGRDSRSGAEPATGSGDQGKAAPLEKQGLHAGFEASTGSRDGILDRKAVAGQAQDRGSPQ